MKQIKIPECIQPIVDSYYANNAKQLCKMVDQILFKLHFVDIDKNDFYSLANEIFMYVVRDYDLSKPFDGFLYSCLYKKFCSEMTRMHREKRKADRLSVSIDAPIGDDKSITLKEIIASDFNLEKEVLESQYQTSKIEKYFNSLTKRQRKIVEMLAASYKPGEIQKILHITQREYADALTGIHAYENISLLF